MPPSQLKRLKASLNAAGVIGPPKSKKEKKQLAKTGGSGAATRVAKHEKLQSIREEFNPFEIKTTRTKYDIGGRNKIKGAQGRPSLSKQKGEENRRKRLLGELEREKKAGGIVDRRFGEDDPTMAPEDRMLERFTQEKQSRLRNSGANFNIDDDDATLTHFGKSLGGLDDFEDGDMLSDGGDDSANMLGNRMKRVSGAEEDWEGSDAEDGPARKKTKKEVMTEIIQKSKLHKHERQKAKEEDEDLREELDGQMGDIWKLLTGPRNAPPPPPRQSDSHMDAGRAALMNGDGDLDQNKRYDAAVREMVFDKRSKPADRTKTDEEKAKDEAERLKKLEDARQKRMRGEESEEEDQPKKGKAVQKQQEQDSEDESETGDAEAYGLGDGLASLQTKQPTDNPDELVDGDFDMDDTSRSDDEDDGSADFSDDYNSDVSELEVREDDEDLDEEFLADVLPEKTNKKPKAITSGNDVESIPTDDKVAFTYPCPESHKDFLFILKDLPTESLPTVIQRIRVLYNPSLAEGNKAKLGNFAVVLLQHIMFVGRTSSPVPFAPLETAMRHLHALSKAHPLKLAEAFREHLKVINERAQMTLDAGDLLFFTALTTIFPTSDHFHPVVTPATLVMAKYLSQSPPNSLQSMAVGSYVATLLLKSEQLSKRYIPEVINFILLSLSLLSPRPFEKQRETFPQFEPSTSLRIKNASDLEVSKATFSSCTSSDVPPNLGVSLLFTLLSLLSTAVTLLVGKSAFTEIFTPAVRLISHLCDAKSLSHLPPILHTKLAETSKTLQDALAHAHHARRPLELHHHRPLPIPSHVPKFDENFAVGKHNDPDRERAESKKLVSLVKKERKGAIREKRKDAQFLARVSLKEEKEASKEYHAKMARLTAMVQHEEGAGKNQYERERRARKRK